MRPRFSQLMESLDGVTEQRLVFNEDTLTVTRRRDEKLLCGVKSQDLSPEFYRSENIIKHEFNFSSMTEALPWSRWESSTGRTVSSRSARRSAPGQVMCGSVPRDQGRKIMTRKESPQLPIHIPINVNLFASLILESLAVSG